MRPLPIDCEARKRCDSPEARSARRCRWSVDPAKRSYYQHSRTARYAARFFS
jgi:hypothetical protein